MMLESIITLGLAGAIIVLALVLLLWRAAARRAYTAPDTVVFARSPWSLPLGAAIVAACVAGLGFVDTQRDGGLVVALALVGLFALAFTGQLLMPALAIWAADHSGLTRQVLAFKTTLPWHTIDWIYPAQKTTTYRTYGIKTGQSSVQSLVVEAGAKTRLKLTLRAWMVGGNMAPLVAAIRQRATDAQFGYDKFQAVQQRRATGGVR